MRQFTAYRNRNPATRTRIPLLLDVQSDLLGELETRVVIPLCAASGFKGQTLSVLTPRLTVDGKDYILMTPQLAGSARRELGAEVADLSAQRPLILAALDLLITGI